MAHRAFDTYRLPSLATGKASRSVFVLRGANVPKSSALFAKKFRFAETAAGDLVDVDKAARIAAQASG
ncbi:hypothetical protein GALL_506530 [mine drainage metagenome]|uniref:Uncharacterized protein n=1 Tax=mine drainage metagenome TaxID=410659 RepID=A0A1J5PJ39_9ZZZZ